MGLRIFTNVICALLDGVWRCTDECILCCGHCRYSLVIDFLYSEDTLGPIYPSYAGEPWSYCERVGRQNTEYNSIPVSFLRFRFSKLQKNYTTKPVYLGISWISQTIATTCIVVIDSVRFGLVCYHKRAVNNNENSWHDEIFFSNVHVPKLQLFAEVY